MGDDRVALGSFALVTLLAGANGVCVRYSNRELDPLWGATLRFALATAVFALVMAALRVAMPHGRALLGVLLYGGLEYGVGFALLYVALVDLHAGFGQVLLALVPLLTLLLAVGIGQETLTRAAVAGAVVATAGIAVMSSEALGGDVPVHALLATLGGALCWAGAAVAVRGFPTVHPAAINTVGMAFGTVLLLGATLVAGDAIVLPEQAETWQALAYVVVLGSVAVFGLYIVLLGRWVASRASYVMVTIPVVTVALSAWLDDEPVTLELFAGSALVLAGVYVGALRRADVTPRA